MLNTWLGSYLLNVCLHGCNFWYSYLLQIRCDLQHGTTSLGWFSRGLWKGPLVATAFWWIYHYDLDGGIEPGLDWFAGFMVDEVCRQHCEGKSLLQIMVFIYTLLILLLKFCCKWSDLYLKLNSGIKLVVLLVTAFFLAYAMILPTPKTKYPILVIYFSLFWINLSRVDHFWVLSANLLSYYGMWALAWECKHICLVQ